VEDTIKAFQELENIYVMAKQAAFLKYRDLVGGSTLTLRIQQFRVVGVQVSSNTGWSGVPAPLCQNL